MHESGLGEGIVEAALRRAAGRPVAGIRVRIGGHPVDPEVIRMSIALAAAGTPAQSCRVDLVLEPMSVSCLACGHAGPVNDHLALVTCAGCGGLDLEVTGSDEVVLESITVADTQVRASVSDELIGEQR